MSDPETVYAARAAASSAAAQPLTSAGTIDPRFSYAFKHHSMSDASSLRGSIAQTDSGAARFIAQVSLYSQSLGVAIAQTTYATDASSQI